jgi:predicted TIM-barrel fold metal-dependent hydrolase
MESQGIDIAFLMPVPGQVIPASPDKRYFIWQMDENMNIHFNSEDGLKEMKNPYAKVNEYIAKVISSNNGKEKLKFIPLIHPILDTPEYIVSLKDHYNPVALKIHGVACGIGPKDIGKDIIKVLRQLDLPIIVHTDYCENPRTPIEHIRRKNNPYDWAMFFIENDLKGYLTHGCRNDLKTFKLVYKYDNLVVGIGPDLKISNERQRWVDKIDMEYLDIIRNELPIDKIMFDIDYSWNIDYNNNIDYGAVERLSKYFQGEEKRRILSKNPERFFGLKERKYNEKN